MAGICHPCTSGASPGARGIGTTHWYWWGLGVGKETVEVSMGCLCYINNKDCITNMQFCGNYGHKQLTT